MFNIHKKSQCREISVFFSFLRGVNDNHDKGKILLKNGADSSAKRTKNGGLYVQKHNVGELNSLVNNCLIIAVCT